MPDNPESRGGPPPVERAAGMKLFDRNLVDRIVDAVKSVVSPNRPAIEDPQNQSTWFGPGQPVEPVAPKEDVAGRQFDYPTAFNLTARPRSYEQINFAQLRALADNYDLLRLAIETRKDQMAKLEWSILPRKRPEENFRRQADDRCRRIESFLRKPDRVHHWADWVRMLVEDQLVIDAPALYLRRDNEGRPWALEPVDGATIVPLIDGSGRRPMPPDPAFQQVLKGVVAAHYTAEELMYFPRNVRTWKVYGQSPVEQIIMTVNIGLRRMTKQLETYTTGNVPDALIGVPETWTTQQIAEYQRYWDSLMETPNQRRKAKFVPGSLLFQPTHMESDQMSPFDEWLARIVCYALSLPPLPFVRMMNRACYSEDTETLTREGWKRLPELSVEDEVATYNPETGGLEFHKPKGLYVYPYQGEMLHFRTRTVDCLVTPDHKMWFRPEGGGSYRKAEAKDLPKGQFHFLASAEPYSGEELELTVVGDRVMQTDDYLEFLGYYLSEGGLSHTKHHYLITLAQKDPHMADRMQECIERCGFSHSVRLDDDGMTRWGIYGKALHQHLLLTCGGYSSDKRIPRFAFRLSPRQRRILFDALMLGDGHWDLRENRTSGYYSSTSRQLADDVQELAYSLGYSAAVSMHYEANGNRRTCWRVMISERREFSLRGEAVPNTPASVTAVPYDGLVYCFEVPNHLFVTRRNGKISIQGNTAQTSYESALEEGLAPMMVWLKNTIDDIIANWFNEPDLELVWDNIRKLDQTEQASLNLQLMQRGIKSLDEIRAEMGLEPLGLGHVIFGIGPMGVISVPALARAIKMGLDMPQPPMLPPEAVDPTTGQPLPDAEGMMGTGDPKADLLADVPPELLHAVGLDPAGELVAEAEGESEDGSGEAAEYDQNDPFGEDASETNLTGDALHPEVARTLRETERRLGAMG